MPLLARKPAPPNVLADKNPLEAVVHLAPDVEAGTDNLGLVQIRKTYSPARGILGFAGRLMRHRYDRRVNLDARGSFLWRQIDGQRSVGQIADALAAEFAVEPAAARQAAILFIRDLMTRHLVLLSFADSPAPGVPGIPANDSLAAAPDTNDSHAEARHA
ncbi:MAG: PqqD family protein [Planctomycetota bacterium]|nr:PqqD family protein [Planctomycetota bacterium]